MYIAMPSVRPFVRVCLICLSLYKSNGYILKSFISQINLMHCTGGNSNRMYHITIITIDVTCTYSNVQFTAQLSMSIKIVTINVRPISKLHYNTANRQFIYYFNCNLLFFFRCVFQSNLISV